MFKVEINVRHKKIMLSIYVAHFDTLWKPADGYTKVGAVKEKVVVLECKVEENDDEGVHHSILPVLRIQKMRDSSHPMMM